MRSSRTRPGQGFTLIEMLVVITIIGIIAAILIPTVSMVQTTTKTNVMIVETNQLSQALETYKLENKDYPPDFTNTSAVIAHVRRAFPRNTFGVGAWLTTSTGAAQDPTRLDPAEALVFWLSLLKNNPRNPFTGTGDAKEYFEFKAEQLTDIDGDGWPEYASKHAEGVPYVYFDGRVQNSASGGAAVCSYAWAVYPPPWSPPFPTPAASPRPADLRRDLSVRPIPVAASGFDFGAARPYRSNLPASNTYTFPNDTGSATPVNNTEWLEPEKFQIVCAGLDGHFGIDNTSGATLIWKQFPMPNYYSASSNGDFGDDRDNVANFGERSIGDSIP